MKPPTSYSSRPNSTASSSSSSSFAKSFGPGRNIPSDRPGKPTRPNHARSKSQAATRPRTAHGHREEEHFDDTANSSNGTTEPPIQPSNTAPALVNSKIRQGSSTPVSSTRESSLSTRFNNLSLHDDSRSQVVSCSASQVSLRLQNVTMNRQGRDKTSVMSPPRSASSQGT